MNALSLAVPFARAEQKLIAPSNKMQQKGKPRCAARSAALMAGHKAYQGAPCKRGHDGLRESRSGKCLTCISLYARSPAGKAASRRYYLKKRTLTPKAPLKPRQKTAMQVALEEAIKNCSPFFRFECKHCGPDAIRYTFAHGICKSCASNRVTKKWRECK